MQGFSIKEEIWSARLDANAVHVTVHQTRDLTDWWKVVWSSSNKVSNSDESVISRFSNPIKSNSDLFDLNCSGFDTHERKLGNYDHICHYCHTLSPKLLVAHFYHATCFQTCLPNVSFSALPLFSVVECSHKWVATEFRALFSAWILEKFELHHCQTEYNGHFGLLNVSAFERNSLNFLSASKFSFKKYVKTFLEK